MTARNESKLAVLTEVSELTLHMGLLFRICQVSSQMMQLSREGQKKHNTCRSSTDNNVNCTYLAQGF